MTVWLIRAGKNGESENLALEANCAIVGWTELGDMSPADTREKLAQALTASYPGTKTNTLRNWESQLWPLRATIEVGDIVVLPLKTRADIALGEVTSAYQYRRDLPGGPFHTRSVKWVKELPRNAFDQDLLFSFGAFMTVCKVTRNDAEGRIKALMQGKPHKPVVSNVGETDAEKAFPNISEQSNDLIRTRIAQKFKGHNMADLVAGILQSQGYLTKLSPPGPDGGVDILAGKGALGFDSPRIIVQVKSQDAKVDAPVVRELNGVMHKYQADNALLVGWGGFTKVALSEASSAYFKMRLWDSGDIVSAVQDNYERLPETLRAEIPLKRVWTLVPDEEG